MLIFVTMSRKFKEYHLQVQVCTYLEYQYPNVQFLSDAISNVKLTAPQQVRNSKIQKKDFKCMDLLIFEPRGKYHGLFIELKVKSPYKKNGDLYKSEHLEGQSKSIEQMKRKGYYACFSWGFERTKYIIDEYMKLKENY